MGLHRKRARLAGEIEAAEARIAPLREALAQVDAVIRLFSPGTNPELIPAIRPASQCLFFRHGEHSRLVLDAMREATKPVRAPWVADWCMMAKGLPVEERELRRMIAAATRVALGRLEKRGLVRRVMQEPEVWWELV